jgi:hypothetical protein
MQLKNSVVLSIVLLICMTSNNVTAETVRDFSARIVKKYNQGSINEYGGNWIPLKSEADNNYKKYLLYPSLAILDQEIKKTKFEKLIYPIIGVDNNANSIIDSLEILIYIRIIENNIPLPKMTEAVFKKLMLYKEGLLQPRGGLYLSILDYVDQDKITYQAYEPSATYNFLKHESLLNYYSKGVNPDIIFPMITSSFYYHAFEPSLGYKILDTMNGHKEQKNFAEQLLNGLEFLRTCTKSTNDPYCPGPDVSLIKDIQRIQKKYGPFKLKDFKNEYCPCSGE